MEIYKSLYERLEDLERSHSYYDKELILTEMIQEVKHAEAYLRLVFNDVVYGIKETTIWNSFNDIEFDISQWASVTDWLATDQVPQSFPAKAFTVIDLIEFANKFTNYSGHEQQFALRNFLALQIPTKRKWFARALLHDLRAGVKVKTVNKVFAKLQLPEIEKFALQLCDKIDVYDESAVAKKIKFPCSMECKYDGIRIQAEIWESTATLSTQVTLTSRRGKDKTNDFPEICEALKNKFAGENVILDGEIIADSFQKLTRKDDTSQRKYIVFDLLNDETLPYLSRWDNLTNLFSNTPDSIIQLAEHYSANNIKDLQEYYTELNRRKEEGIIIKLDNSPYERGSRKHMFKCKKVYTADLIITGYKLGEGKRAGKVATLCLKDASGKIIVDVGSGIDDTMCQILTNYIINGDYNFIGSICEILYNEITETGSIRFPRFVKIRDDKTEADTLWQNSL